VGRYNFWPKKRSVAALFFHQKKISVSVFVADFCCATALLAEKAAKNR
jgi:hypothetical protein